MTAPDAAHDAAVAVDALLDRAIGAITAGPSSAGPPGVGRSPDERVTATVTGASVTALELDPRVLRDGADALAASVIAAVNAAVDARPAGGSSAAQELRAVKEESAVQAARFRQALQEQLEQLAAGAQEDAS